ncbi:MAG: SpvB/TcaC N-terminal domain-containing protein, partial [Gammaproteobacteria bacterium]
MSTPRRGLAALFALLFAPAALSAIYVNPSPSPGTHTVSWDTYPPAPDFLRYELLESTNGTTWPIVYSGGSSSTNLTGRTPGTYMYRLNYCSFFYTYNDPNPFVICLPVELLAGIWQTSVVVAIPPPAPSAITGPTTDTDGAYALSWGTSSGALSYELQEKIGTGAWTTIQNTTATSKSFTGKTDATYSYRVRACGPVICSAWTVTLSVQVMATPGVPGAITGPATDADGTYSIAWTGSTGNVASYKLEERITGGIFAQIQSSLALGKSFVGKINNTYEYRVKACNAVSCSAYTAIKFVQVTTNAGDATTPNAPPAPQVVSIPAPSATSDAIGVLPATFRIDESGAASYSVPIYTVPGSGGVAPHVALDYSSQAGNGIAGVGWRLAGLSVITRCRQTKETDNVPGMAVKFVSTDRFCLDGQRLVLVTGTYGANNAEYRTEIDSFAKIISYGAQGGGPSYFKVWRKDGSVSEYGNTTNSKIEAFGANSAVFAWAQNKFT